MKTESIVIDGKSYKLPDISYQMFVQEMPWEGASDVAYAQYLRTHDMHEISSFNEESLANARLVFVDHADKEYTFLYQAEPNKEDQ